MKGPNSSAAYPIIDKLGGMKLTQNAPQKRRKKMGNGTYNKHGGVQLTVVGELSDTRTTDNGVWCDMVGCN
jgi:hypothetical protein